MVTICLNMIVKNESKIIKRLLESVVSIIGYYVICDTGSTDNTIEVIKTFFESKKIDGIIFHEKFINFCHNRNVSLKKCKGLTDYVLLLDADMVLCIDNSFDKNTLVDDMYKLTQGSEHFYYDNVRICKNDGNYYYVGVTHEYICSPPNATNGKISKELLFISDVGDGGSKLNKFERDKQLLLDGILAEPDNVRYHFYLANTYRDLGDHENAILYYKKRIELGGWYEERYVSCMYLYKFIKDESRFYYLMESYNFNSKRVECILELIKHYTCKSNYNLAYNYYTFIQDYYENEYYPSNGDVSEYLFANVSDYSFYLPYYMIIVSEHLKKHSTGILMYKVIFKRKSIESSWWINNLIFNLQFYEGFMDSQFKSDCREYIQFINERGIILTCNKTMELIKPQTEKQKLLFYVGFSNEPWNITYTKKHALGGSELAVCYLAQELGKYYSVYIGGAVEEETNNDVTFVNMGTLGNMFNKGICFDVIVVSRYVSFFTLFPNWKGSKLFLMAHDTSFLNNLSGCTLSSNEIIKNIKVDSVVCLTNWHKEYIKEHYPELKCEYSVINNGINPKLFKKLELKRPNSFIYTSCSYRGLKRVLELWPEILKNIPSATLSISSYLEFPSNDEDKLMQKIINEHKSIKHYGKLNSHELYDLMGISEYWLYTCSFYETSCITAMEMLMSEVICLYYPLGGLTDTLGDYGIQVSNGNEVTTILSLSQEQKNEYRNKGKEYALRCSWENRALEWNKLFTHENNNSKMIVDCFIFYNEIDMLKYRLRTLKDVVDYFILVESTRTFTGKPKILYFQENKDIFSDFNNIIHIIIDDFPFIEPTKEQVWVNEKFQRNCITRGLERLMLKDSDILIFSDVDEIPDPKTIKRANIDSIYSLEQDFYYYNLESMIMHKWYKSKITDYRNFKNLLLSIDEIRCGNYPCIKRGGWHLSYFGTPESISNKIKNFSHQEYNLPEYTDISTISYRIENKLDLFLRPFDSIGSPNKDYLPPNFKNEWIFLYQDDFTIGLIKEYLNNLNFNIKITNDKQYILDTVPEKVTVILKYDDNDFLKKIGNVSLLNTEPLNTQFNLDNILSNYCSYTKIYDYSLSNIKIMKDHSITNCEHLPYNVTTLEKENLERHRKNSDIIYDFGIICGAGNNTTDPKHLTPERRRKVVEYLISQNFKCNIICGWGEDRDSELAKCRTILNIHGERYEPSNIFEHLRCDRLLEAGFNILSETSYELDKDFIDRYPNLKIIEYSDFFKIKKQIKNYCFIHSCTLPETGTKTLDYLLIRLKDLSFETIFVNNIGLPIEKNYEENISIKNYSTDNLLWEIPTINKIRDFSIKNKNCNILYLHTKGILHNNDNVNDWIEMMLHFLIDKKCISLLKDYDTLGCNYCDNPKHYSGNFWWATSNYLSTLSDCMPNKNDAEFWLHIGNPKYFVLHQSGINHYYERYPKEKYVKKVIGFHSDGHLCERGTEVALFDYAYYNQKINGFKSVIFYQINHPANNNSVIEKFKKEFEVIGYTSFEEINNYQLEYFYNIKQTNDYTQLTKFKNLSHVVFYIQKDILPKDNEIVAVISKHVSNNNVQIVPHMINLSIHSENMKSFLGIPENAIVLGRHGGYDEFNITYVYESIIEILQSRNDIYFLFVNTRPFYKHSRIIYLDQIIDIHSKVKFINTCDAMIHARIDGESFGLAIGEFSSCNKPVITTYGNYNNHIDILRERAIIYTSKDSLVFIFNNFTEIKKIRTDWNCYAEYTPEKVMKIFNNVFLNTNRDWILHERFTNNSGLTVLKKINTGFIILRHVNKLSTNNYWNHCYNCIRKYYPEHPILIIDDNSNYEYISEQQPLYKTHIIKSEYPGRGELLPYYYYLHNKLFDTAVIIHDSVFVNKYIDLNVNKYKIIWDFEHDWDQIEDETKMIKLFNDSELLKFYEDKELWKGCFGCMSIIKHDYLKYINSKYDISKLLSCVLTRYNRQSFERVLACLLQKNQKEQSLLGNIHKYVAGVAITYEEKDNYKHLPLIKVWTCR